MSNTTLSNPAYLAVTHIRPGVLVFTGTGTPSAFIIVNVSPGWLCCITSLRAVSVQTRRALNPVQSRGLPTVYSHFVGTETRCMLRTFAWLTFIVKVSVLPRNVTLTVCVAGVGLSKTPPFVAVLVSRRKPRVKLFVVPSGNIAQITMPVVSMRSPRA